MVGSTVYNYYYADVLSVLQIWGTTYMDFLYDESCWFSLLFMTATNITLKRICRAILWQYTPFIVRCAIWNGCDFLF